MDDWPELIETILRGYKLMLYGIVVIAFSAGLVWGVVSAIMLICGRTAFQWWYVPCWILDLSAFAGCIGASNE